MAVELAGAWISIRIINWLVDLRLRDDAYRRLIIQFLGSFHDHLAKLPPGYRKQDLRTLRFELQEFRRRTGHQQQHLDSNEQRLIDRVVKDLSAVVAEIERFDNTKSRASRQADDIQNLNWLPKQEAEKLVDPGDPGGETVGALYRAQYFDILESNNQLRSVRQQYSAIATDPLYEKSSTTYENDIRYISDLKQNFDVLKLPALLEVAIRNYLDAVYEAGILRYELDRRLERVGEQIYRARFNLFQETQ